MCLPKTMFTINQLRMYTWWTFFVKIFVCDSLKKNMDRSLGQHELLIFHAMLSSRVCFFSAETNLMVLLFSHVLFDLQKSWFFFCFNGGARRGCPFLLQKVIFRTTRHHWFDILARSTNTCRNTCCRKQFGKSIFEGWTEMRALRRFFLQKLIFPFVLHTSGIAYTSRNHLRQSNDDQNSRESQFLKEPRCAHAHLGSSFKNSRFRLFWSSFDCLKWLRDICMSPYDCL